MGSSSDFVLDIKSTINRFTHCLIKDKIMRLVNDFSLWLSAPALTETIVKQIINLPNIENKSGLLSMI